MAHGEWRNGKKVETKGCRSREQMLEKKESNRIEEWQRGSDGQSTTAVPGNIYADLPGSDDKIRLIMLVFHKVHTTK